MIDIKNITLIITGNDERLIPLYDVKHIIDEFDKADLPVISIDVEKFSWQSFGNYILTVVSGNKEVAIIKDRGDFYFKINNASEKLVPVEDVYPQLNDVSANIFEQLDVLKQQGFFNDK